MLYGGIMKNIIYSIYIENNDTDLKPIHQFTKSQLAKHYQKLLRCDHNRKADLRD